MDAFGAFFGVEEPPLVRPTTKLIPLAEVDILRLPLTITMVAIAIGDVVTSQWRFPHLPAIFQLVTG